ncbi:sigma-70 family RNA polymerase sigma factor [Solimicrobium silvestre]|uniref:RNA polymerase sigma factor n=1 Tax=Solimicrobium silvestre TaxID=2099400 RepID=A0A2S9GSW2_9BURK|nr:sigma-70 family RNA polymerase sigma factor [Solimicrobium silvestre]PRC90809.1 sigma70-ECF: RNA polymerase sigma factor, sigma-70 family [Solimicrobium silvestre]
MGSYLNDVDETSRFEAIVLPHLDAAYNLARWLTRNDHDAEDLVQMAFVRAFKFYSGFHGGNARAWLLTIVRHTFYTSLRDQQPENEDVNFDEALHSAHENSGHGSPYDIGCNPENSVENSDTSRVVNQALEKLPQTFREIVILKEIENLSYKEIAEVAGIPIGTVMSRLARGRKLLLNYLQQVGVGGSNGL